MLTWWTQITMKWISKSNIAFAKNYQGDIIVEIREIVIGNPSLLISYITRYVFVDVIL